MKQLCVEIGQLNFVWPQMTLSREASVFSVVSDPPKITMSSDGKGMTSFELVFQISTCVKYADDCIAVKCWRMNEIQYLSMGFFIGLSSNMGAI